MFVDLVRIEKNAEILADKEDVAIYSARVSYRTRQTFRYVKEGKSNNTNRQFIEATFFVNKRKVSETETKQSFTEKDLVKGTTLFVSEGDIGVDEVDKEGGKKQYFTKLKISRATVVKDLPPTEEPEEPDNAPFKVNTAPARPPAFKPTALRPRPIKDPVDSVPSLPPVAGWNA